MWDEKTSQNQDYSVYVAVDADEEKASFRGSFTTSNMVNGSDHPLEARWESDAFVVRIYCDNEPVPKAPLGKRMSHK